MRYEKGRVARSSSGNSAGGSGDLRVKGNDCTWRDRPPTPTPSVEHHREGACLYVPRRDHQA